MSSYSPMDMEHELELMQASEDGESESENLGEAAPARLFGLRRSMLGLLICATAAACTIAATKWMPAGSPVAANVLELMDKELVSCDTQWSSTSSAEPTVKEAAENAFKLVAASRAACSPAVGQFKFDDKDFTKGDGHKHYMHAHVKSASDCKSTTYKLHFFSDPSTSFVLQVNQNEGTKAWTLLDSNPTACNIRVGSAATLQAQPVTDKVVKEAAKFAMAEYNYQTVKSSCPNAGKFELHKIKACVVSVLAGLNMNLLLDVKVKWEIFKPPVTLKMKVIERCAGSTPCIRQLSLPDDACAMLGNGAATRLLFEKTMIGAYPNDPTDLMVAQKQDLYTSTTRRLGSAARAALQPRNIQEGSMPSTWDPRSHECFRQITVYDQGSCGSCYAAAIAQMMGIRKCLKDKGGSRRLDETAAREQLELEEQPDLGDRAEIASKEEDGTPEDEKEDSTSEEEAEEESRRLGTARVTKKGCPCKKEWFLGTTTLPGADASSSGVFFSSSSSNLGSQCTNYCCNPDNSAGDWCYVTEGEGKDCEGNDWGLCKPQQTPQPACADSTTWNHIGKYCDYFAANNEAGDCSQYEDYGQRVHCKKTCNTCPSTVNQDTNANPWYGALYDYMPAVADLAKCAKDSDGAMLGCGGGSTQGVWNNYLKDSNRQVWIMGDQCKPYDMKCTSSSGVVNPLSGGECSAYADYQTWHKPCSCISERPSSFQCPSDSPSSSCDFPVPPAFFTVSGVSQSLSIADAVLNFQRHIHEYGPIYVTFDTTNAFMHWDWDENPVYTGGNTVEGGHAVILVGWGRRGSTDYWLFRNSWGPDWADKGYGKFLRGSNLDGIESDGGASMPDSEFQDWSPPYCSLDTWSWSYNNAATKYDLKLQITCSKKSSLSIFLSNRLTDRKQIEQGVTGVRINAKASKAGKQFSTQKIDCVGLGFGKEPGDMWVKMTADDGKGNEADTSHFIALDPVGKYR